MRKLGKDPGAQLYAKSHPDITAILKHDVISFRSEEWIYGKGPDAGQMLSALVLAYGRLCLGQRRRLMEVLIRDLAEWLNEGPEPSREDLIRRCVEAITPPGGADGKGGDDGPSPPTPPKVVGGHTIGGRLPKRGADERHSRPDRRSNGDKVRPKP